MSEVTGNRLIGLDDYIKTFSDNRPTITANGVRIATNYFRVIEKDIRDRINPLEGDQEAIDTALEWALTSYYSPAVVQIRPEEAKAILPADNPKLSGKILGANLYKEIQVLGFLADKDTMGRYEGMLKFVCDKNGVTRAEVEKYYRDGIRGLVSDIVDEEFNKIIFLLENTSIRKSHNATLTRNPQTGQYILSYEGVNTNGETRTVKGDTLEALSSAMRTGQYKADFDETGISAVRAQAALIPAAALSDAALNEIKNFITRFFIEPNQSTYKAILESYVFIDRTIISTKNFKYSYVLSSYGMSLLALFGSAYNKVFTDRLALKDITVLTKDQQQRLIELRR